MTLAEVFERVAGPDAPVEFRAYDGSSAGPAGAPVRITVKSPVAVRYLAQSPGALGLARAYVSGHLDLDGDMYTALTRMSHAQQTQLGAAEQVRLLGQLGGPKLLYPRIPPPPLNAARPEHAESRRGASGGCAARALSCAHACRPAASYLAAPTYRRWRGCPSSRGAFSLRVIITRRAGPNQW